jgi:hypothetical protein
MSEQYAEPPRQAGPAHFEIFSVRDQVHWRLLSRNNRDGGQSSTGFADGPACRAGIARMLELLPQLQAQHLLTTDYRWNWTLLLGDEVLARSSHSFDRRTRCIAACDWFYRAAPLAGIREGLRVVRSSAADSRRGGLPSPPGRAIAGRRADVDWRRSSGSGRPGPAVRNWPRPAPDPGAPD